MNKKRMLASALLAAVMCVSVTGCGKSDPEKELENAINDLEKEFNNYNNNNTVSTPAVSKPDPKPLDPFEGVTVTFEGISPTATASVKGENTNVIYTLDRNRDLANGDKVTVTAELRGGKTEEYTLTSDSKEFTVENRPAYITKLADLTDSDVEKLSKKITDLVPDDVIGHAGGGEGTTVNSLEFIGNINLTKSNENYRLYFVYKANVTFAKAETTEDYIFAACFERIYKESDGTFVFKDGRPLRSDLGDMSLSPNGFYVGGAYASVDSLNSSLSGYGAERESNVKE